MIELKSQVNFRVNTDCNISLAITHMVVTAEEAESAGASDARMVDSYLDGYATASKEAADE